MKEVYTLVMDDRNYDSGSADALIAFEDKDEAEALAALLNKTVAERGKCPAIGPQAGRHSYEARDAWEAALKAKLEAIQEGASNCEFDYVDYQVQTLPFIQKVKA